MMADIYELVKTYKTWVNHKRSGEMIDLEAKVFRGNSSGELNIFYSHFFVPKEGSKAWASDSFTHAASVEEAKSLFKSWAEMMEKSHEVMVWEAN